MLHVEYEHFPATDSIAARPIVLRQEGFHANLSRLEALKLAYSLLDAVQTDIQKEFPNIKEAK